MERDGGKDVEGDDIRDPEVCVTREMDLKRRRRWRNVIEGPESNSS